MCTGRFLKVDPVGAAKPNLLIGESTSPRGGQLGIPNPNLLQAPKGVDLASQIRIYFKPQWGSTWHPIS